MNNFKPVEPIFFKLNMIVLPREKSAYHVDGLTSAKGFPSGKLAGRSLLPPNFSFALSACRSET